MSELTQAQIDLRRTGITSSDVAAVLGLIPESWPHRRTAWDVWNDKVLGLEGSGPSEERSWIGHVVEDNVLAPWYASKYKVHPSNLTSPGTIVRGEGWMITTPDRLHIDPSGHKVVEFKCVGARVMYDWGTGAEEVPAHIAVQCHWHMAVTKLDECRLVALVGGTEIREYNIKRDHALELRIVGQMRDFWFESVVPQMPPSVDGSVGCRNYLLTRYPTNDAPTACAATPEAECIASLRMAAAQAIKDNGVAVDELDNKLCELVGAAGVDKFLGTSWSFKWTPNKGSDGKRRTLFTVKK